MAQAVVFDLQGVLVTEQGYVVPGVVEFIATLHQSGIPVAVATGSSREYAQKVFAQLQIQSLISASVTADDVANTKPDPEVYLTAAEYVGIPPALCIAFEDSLPGIHAAKSAGMQVVGVATTHKREELTVIDVIIDDFQDITPEDITNFREFRTAHLNKK